MSDLNQTEHFIFSDDIENALSTAAAEGYFHLFRPPYCVIAKNGQLLKSSQSFNAMMKHTGSGVPFDNIYYMLTKKSVTALENSLLSFSDEIFVINARRPDGKKIYLETGIQNFSFGGTDAFLLIFHDITKDKKIKAKQKKQERLLIQQSKMAAMGEMLGVIAHQWKQPLNNISIIAQNIGDDFDHNGLDIKSVDRYIDDINGQIRFMSSTVDDFRRFFIPQKTASKFPVIKAVKDTVELVNPQLKAGNIAVFLSVQEEDIDVMGYCNEFRQVILNLLVNAKDAIVHKRESDQLFRTEQGRIDIRISSKDNLCRLEIEDNGGGISEKAMKKVFKPYFTTKSESGTGIGLYLSKTIVENKMHGRLSAKNAAHGALFEIEIPVANE